MSNMSYSDACVSVHVRAALRELIKLQKGDPGALEKGRKILVDNAPTEGFTHYDWYQISEFARQANGASDDTMRALCVKYGLELH
jgi:hypothetical protein